MTIESKTNKAIAEIGGRITNAEEQAPVWEALKAKLTAMQTDVQGAVDDMTAKLTDLDTAQADLKTKLEPIQA